MSYSNPHAWSIEGPEQVAYTEAELHAIETALEAFRSMLPHHSLVDVIRINRINPDGGLIKASWSMIRKPKES